MQALASRRACGLPGLTPRRCGAKPIGHQNAFLNRRICFTRATEQEAVPDVTYDFVAANQGAMRALPLWAGGLGFVGLLANRFVSGVAPVVDASSAQSRADVLGIVMSAVLLLTGLQWLSLKPRAPLAVQQEGVDVDYVDPKAKLPPGAADELRWCWRALGGAARATALVAFVDGRNVAHFGLARKGHNAGSAAAGDVVRACVAKGRGNYLANLVLYPGRIEFVSYLPEATQGVAVQPIGNRGALVVATDTQRGLSRLDQAWIATLADKLEVTLEGYTAPQPGRGFAARGGGSSGSGSGSGGSGGGGSGGSGA